MDMDIEKAQEQVKQTAFTVASANYVIDALDNVFKVNLLTDKSLETFVKCKKVLEAEIAITLKENGLEDL